MGAILRDREVRDGHVIDEIQLGLQWYVLLLTEHGSFFSSQLPSSPSLKSSSGKPHKGVKVIRKSPWEQCHPRRFWFLVEAQLNCARGFLIDVRWESRISVGLLSLAPASF